MTKDIFNDKARQPAGRPNARIATRADVDRLKADRENDHARAAPAPKPTWATEASTPSEKHIRMRERRIRHLENRLEGAKQKMEQAWDRSS